mmetsp:Transcript_15268/g.43486  ORF Transcript_15268/g.43486 Transcript_15268/m.43486 type:complete len:257 (-) Transcript_15268:3265-4035(-)
MCFQDFFGGRTLNTTPSENGSKESTNSSSASPPNVIIWYISLSFNVILANPAMNSSNLFFRKSSSFSRQVFLTSVAFSSSVSRSWYSDSFSRYWRIVSRLQIFLRRSRSSSRTAISYLICSLSALFKVSVSSEGSVSQGRSSVSGAGGGAAAASGSAGAAPSPSSGTGGGASASASAGAASSSMAPSSGTGGGASSSIGAAPPTNAASRASSRFRASISWNTWAKSRTSAACSARNSLSNASHCFCFLPLSFKARA